MMFKQNYLKELPDDIQDKIYMMVNKNKFNDCLKKIDNRDIRMFHNLYEMIKNDWFGITYELYADNWNKGLGWFDNNYSEGEMETEEEYEMFERNKRLSYKEYTLSKPEYMKIKYYRFTYYVEDKFCKAELKYINKKIKEYIEEIYDEETYKKIVFKNNKIDVYFGKSRKWDETAVDIIQNIFWGYRVVIDSLKYTANTGCEIDFLIDWFENHNFLVCFDTKNKVIEPYFES